MDKKANRLRRAKRTRMKIREKRVARLCIYRTPQHIYAQVISADGDATLACASTLDGEVKKAVGYGGNVDAAKVVGKIVAERALTKGISSVAFDRSGFRYHGRVRALADAAREAGLVF